MNQVYIFEIHDNDLGESNLMLYSLKESYLTPLVPEFEFGQSKFLSFNEIINYLSTNKLNSLTTYTPCDPDTLCSHPYELGDFTQQELDSGPCYYLYDHMEFTPCKYQEEVLAKTNIVIECLSSDKIIDLENRLESHSDYS